MDPDQPDDLHIHSFQKRIYKYESLSYVHIKDPIL